MLTSLRPTLLLAGLVGGLAGGLVLLGSGPAAADCSGGGIKCTPVSNGSTVTVSVTGSFVKPGSPGSPGGGTTTVQVPVPCWFIVAWTGKEYFDGVEDGTINGAGGYYQTDDDWAPIPGYRQHKDDTEGHYYNPVCSNNTDLPADDFVDFANDFFDAHDSVWVDAGGAPPVPPVPPEVLLLAAQEAMSAPEPAFEHNPDVAGAFDTLVNFDTWFWLDDPTQDGSVTATAGANSVTVDATLASVVFSAPTAGAVPCDDTGTEWKQGSASDCVLDFEEPGTAAVTADTQWAVTWSFNGQPQGAVDPLSATYTEDLAVAQSQTLVTDVG